MLACFFGVASVGTAALLEHSYIDSAKFARLTPIPSGCQGCFFSTLEKPLGCSLFGCNKLVVAAGMAEAQ